MTEKGFVLPSFAKINLFLKVGGKREDGFHDLCTVLQTVSLHDSITFEPAESLTVECSDPRLPTGRKNLAFRAAEELRDQAGIRAGARIRIEKRIPFPGGLAGGSSNAATTLLGLSSLWGIAPAHEDLVRIGAELGSDVPFFLLGGTVLGTGRGTDLDSLPDQEEKLLLIASPEAEYSTAEAYRSLGRSGLTSGEPETTLIVCRELAEKLISGLLRPFNDFEETVDTLAPQTKTVRTLMADFGASSAVLSGSGPSVYGIFENEDRRQAAFERFRDVEGVRIFAAETVTRTAYREALGDCGELLPDNFI